MSLYLPWLRWGFSLDVYYGEGHIVGWGNSSPSPAWLVGRAMADHLDSDLVVDVWPGQGRTGWAVRSRKTMTHSAPPEVP